MDGGSCISTTMGSEAEALHAEGPRGPLPGRWMHLLVMTTSVSATAFTIDVLAIKRRRSVVIGCLDDVTDGTGGNDSMIFVESFSIVSTGTLKDSDSKFYSALRQSTQLRLTFI